MLTLGTENVDARTITSFGLNHSDLFLGHLDVGVGGAVFGHYLVEDESVECAGEVYVDLVSQVGQNLLQLLIGLQSRLLHETGCLHRKFRHSAKGVITQLKR